MPFCTTTPFTATFAFAAGLASTLLCFFAASALADSSFFFSAGRGGATAGGGGTATSCAWPSTKLEPDTAHATPISTSKSRSRLISGSPPGSLAAGVAFQPVEILVQPGAKFFGQNGPRLTGHLRDAAVLADLFLVDARSQKGHGRIDGLAGAAAARVGAAATTTASRIDPARPQQKLDGLGLGGDGLGTGLRPAQDPGRLVHHAGDLAQQVDLIGELALGIGQLADPLDHLV